MTENNHPSRDDGRFLRRIIYILLSTVIGSSGALVWALSEMRADINHNSNAVKEIKKLQTTMTSIQVGVAKLVENSEIRNDIMREEKKRNDYVFGEQKRRLSTIKRSNKHMDNWSIHVKR